MAFIRSAAILLATLAFLVASVGTAAAGSGLKGRPSWATKASAKQGSSSVGRGTGALPRTGTNVALQLAIAALLLAAGATLRMSPRARANLRVRSSTSTFTARRA